MRSLMNLASLGWLSLGAEGRVAPGSIVDDSPLVVVYYENWAGWIRNFSPSHLEKNILSRDMPVRNFVLNYAFYTWNYDECSLIAVDSIDLQKGDKGGWTPDDWNIDSLETWATSKPIGGHLPAFMMLKAKYPHIKLLPSIGGWSRSHTYHDCLINRMDHMIDSVMDHVAVWGWDGIDLDWEYPNCDGAPCGCQGEATCTKDSGFSNVAGAGDWERYKTFVKTVRSRFNDLEDKLGRRLYITAALGMNPKVITGNNDVWSEPMPIEWICDEDDFDWVNLMTYDFYGPWAKLTGPLAPLYPNPNLDGDQMSIDDSITKILARCSRPEKLTMGLATYGKSWQGVPNTGEVPGLWQTSTANDQRGGGTWELGTLSWFDLKHNILPQCTRTWDDASKTPTAYCDTLPPAPGIPYDTGSGAVQRGQPQTFISYEDGESWKEKMAYARSKGMAGAIIWAASDTGCGESFAPDSTTDLFEGLFEGWFGQKISLPASSSLAPSPGSLQRWAEYPCPLVTGWAKGPATIDIGRCAGKTYTHGKTYLTIPQSANPKDIGKDKLLIHSLGGAAAPTQRPVTTTTTELAPVPLTTASPTKRPVLTTSTPAPAYSTSKKCNCDCKRSTTTTPAPTFAPVPPTEAPVEPPTSSAARSKKTCKSKKTTTQAKALSAVEECGLLLHTAPEYRGMCKTMCQVVIDRQICQDLNTGDAIATCVEGYVPYCHRTAQ